MKVKDEAHTLNSTFAVPFIPDWVVPSVVVLKLLTPSQEATVTSRWPLLTFCRVPEVLMGEFCVAD